MAAQNEKNKFSYYIYQINILYFVQNLKEDEHFCMSIVKILPISFSSHNILNSGFKWCNSVKITNIDRLPISVEKWIDTSHKTSMFGLNPPYRVMVTNLPGIDSWHSKLRIPFKNIFFKDYLFMDVLITALCFNCN